MGASDTQGIAVQQTGTANQLSPAQKQRLKKAAQEFESVFVGYMLKTMRQSVQESNVFGEGFGGDIFNSLFDSELAKKVSQGGSFGLAETMYKELTGESLSEDNAASETQGTQPSSPASKRTSGVSHKTVPSRSMTDRINRYQSLIEDAAQKNSIDSTLVKAVIATESAGHPYAQSSKDAKGLMQLIDSTASDMGVKNVWNPKDNIEGGAKYLKQMLDKFNGDVQKAVASYNAGPTAVEKHNGVPPYRETKEYVNRVMNYWNYFQQQEGQDDGN